MKTPAKKRATFPAFCAAFLLAASSATWAQQVIELSPGNLSDFLKKNNKVVLQLTSPDKKCGFCVGADVKFDRAVAKAHAVHPQWVYARVQWSPWRDIPKFQSVDLDFEGVPSQALFIKAKNAGVINGATQLEIDIPMALERAEKGGTTPHMDMANPSDQERRDKASVAQPDDSTTGIEFYVRHVKPTKSTLGELPFFSPPQGYEYGNSGGKKWAFGTTFVPVTGQRLVPVEGPSFGAYIWIPRRSTEKYSSSFVLKSFDEIIASVGGVKIFDGTIPVAEVKRADQDRTLRKSEGSIDWYNTDKVKTYAIRPTAGGMVFVLLQSNSAGGSIQVVQTEAFNQTIVMKDAKTIQSELETSGKAVLQINFEIAKAVLMPDGLQLVGEIAIALQTNPQLRVSIEGHTDTTGSDTRNLLLSKERAQTVQQILLLSGIEKSKLKAAGFGSGKPVATNSTEAGMAQNRRVELIRY